MFSIPAVERQRVPLSGNPVRRLDPIYSLHLHRTLIQPAFSDKEKGARAPRQSGYPAGTVAASPVNTAMTAHGGAPKEDLQAERVVEFYVGPATGSQLKLWTETRPVTDAAAVLEPVAEDGSSQAGF